ncbi:phosphomannomutase/phosphoglucomutase [bacterium]|jgi:phosphomannomutase / phosphoglucomutase|nr:phosphomannomutase/phosphoglucomutase [bacterium]
MKDHIFRQYDIRGKVGDELVVEEVYDLGRALAYYFLRKNPSTKSVAIGMDGRTHSPIIKDQLCEGLRDSGLNVTFIGLCSSPVLYFSMFTESFDAGLMVTASHNGKEYNGVKICLGKGFVSGDEIQKEIKGLFFDQKYVMALSRGSLSDKPMVPSYINWLSEHFEHLKGLNIGAVVDCGNGAAGAVLPDLVRAMEWKNIHLLYPEVDGTYPNHTADPVVEKNMLGVRQFLKENEDVHLGIGLDGDCDRMAPMTKKGYLVPGDKLLAIFYYFIKNEHPKATVVFDVKASSGLIEVLKEWGARPFMSPSGHSHIKNNMKEQDAIVAGELSCHFFFKDRHFGFDDGVYAMMRLFEIVIGSCRPLDDLLKIFPHKFSSREYRITCAEKDKKNIVDNITKVFAAKKDAEVVTVDGVRATMDYGWGVVRSSNTQPVLSIRFEANTEKDLSRVRDDFLEALRAHFDDGFLKENIDL